MKQIRVFLIEDDPMVQEVNRLFVEQTEGFIVVGCAPNGQVARQLLDELKPDLVLLDIYMAVEDGIATIKNLRKNQKNVDIIAVTAANDSETIRTFMRYGVVDYIVKPFTYKRLLKALTKYREMHEQFKKTGEFSQANVDELFKQQGINQPQKQEQLPKGLQFPTMNQIVGYLESVEGAKSAEEIGTKVGLARVTVNRYLNYLDSIHRVTVELNYGTVGRPIKLYRLISNKGRGRE